MATKDWLTTEYVTKNRTFADIRAELGLSKSAMYRLLARHEISKVKQKRSLDKKWLLKRYVEDLADVNIIADEAGVSVDTVKSWASIWGLKRGHAFQSTDEGRRKYSKPHTDASRRKMSKAKMKPGEGYTRGKFMQGQDRRYVHRIIAQEVLKRELRSSEVVHHMDCDKTNHHPTNLLVLDRTSHSALHIVMRAMPELDQIKWLSENKLGAEYLGNKDYHESPCFKEWYGENESNGFIH